MSCEDLKNRATQMYEHSRLLIQDTSIMANGGSASFMDMLNTLFEIKYDINRSFDDLEDCHNKGLLKE